MAIIVKRANREIRNTGAFSFEIGAGDVGKTYDIGGIAEGFRVKSVNVTVDVAFANIDNKISVGLEAEYLKFMPQTTIDSIKGIDGNGVQFTAPATTPIIVDVVGTASATGKATVTVEYLKLANARQEY